MISELNKIDFSKCSSIIDLHTHIEAKAIIEGNNPGRIFVDCINEPKTGLIWLGNNDGFIFIGNENNEPFQNDMKHFLDTVILPEAQQLGLKWFECFGNHSGWDKTIENMFSERELGSWEQRIYIRLNDQPLLEVEINTDYTVEKITEDFFYSKNITNLPFLHEKIKEFWPSIEEFSAKGFGFCAIYDQKIVSICFSAFVAEGFHAVDIETLEGHRGQQLALNVASAFAKECYDRGVTPYWDCMKSNIPSVKTAERLGFTCIYNYKGYDFQML